MFTGRTVLLTGGGSVGQSLVPRILDHDPGELRVLDNNEPGLAALQSRFDDDRLRPIAGDIRDERCLRRAIARVDDVIHTAAMKHVDVCERNPYEAVKTNVMGLQNLVEAARDSSVQRVVFTSSDKAVHPANAMGTTKLLGEQLITAGNYGGDEDLRLTSVRFGNVINSSQSVIPRFTEQIRTGGPVTLTDERMTRFLLTDEDVFDLVSQALERTRGGEVFVSKMPAVRIVDLAGAMIETVAPKYGHDPSEIDLELIGRRPGETFHEGIMTPMETERAYENESLYAIRPESTGEQSVGYPEEFAPAEDVVRSSEHAEKLSRGEIVTLLRDSGVEGEYQSATAPRQSTE